MGGDKHLHPRLLIGGAVVLVAIIALSVIAATSYVSAAESVDHTLLVQQEAEEWLVAVVDAETGVRGYVISANDVFLEPYTLALERERKKRSALDALVAAEPRQSQNVETAKRDATLAIDVLRELVATVRSGHASQAMARVASGDNKHAVDAFRADIREIRAEEETLLRERRSSARQSALITIGGATLLTLVSASFLAFAWVAQRRRADELAILTRDARRRLEALSSVAASLAAVRTRAQVAKVVIDEGARAVGADTCTLYMLDQTGKTLELIGDRGVPAEVLDRVRRITETSETGETFKTLKSGKPLWAETPDDYSAMFPKLAAMKTDGPRAKAFWSMPLIVEGQAVGLLGVGFYEPRKFSPEERSFIETFTKQCAQALVRAERLESEDEAQQLFATTLRSIGDAVIATDPNGNVTFVNAIAERLTGWPIAEALGKNLDEVFCIFSEETRKVVESPVAKVLREGAIVGLANHTVLRSRRGHETPIDDSAAPIRDEAGTLFGVVLVFRDVTAEKRTQVQREFLARAGEALVSSMDYRTTLATVARLAVPELADWCAVDVVDVSGGGAPQQLALAHVDSAKTQLVRELSKRYPPDWNAKTGVPQVIRTGKSELYTEISPEMLEAGARDDEQLRILRELKLESGMVVPLRAAGRVLGAMTFAYAESGRRYTPSDLAFAEDFARRAAMAIDNATSMAEIVQARGREHALREQAELANRAKDEFLATVSHELRTPLTAILGWTLMLRARKLDPEIDGRLAVIERNARAQTKLIEDVLDVSRIISGKLVLDLSATNVVEVVRAAIETVTPASEAKGITLALDLANDSTVITADANRLQQVVWNLLTNAVKFTPNGGSMAVRVYRDGKEICIVVKDSGEGIRADALALVFAPFQQADASTTRRHGGLGLGLAIVKHLVTAHGGTVTAESEGEGKGATFVVRLPSRLESPATARTSGHHNVVPRLDGLRVLVLDDEEDARTFVGAVLSQHGAAVELVASATEALERVRSTPPDVIVSDIGMPQVDGYAFIRQVRAMPTAAGGRTPAVALTAFARGEDAQRAFAAGYQTHIAKPIEPERLVTVVANLGGRTHDLVG